MNSQLDEFSDFSQSFILVNDDVAQTINQPYNDLLRESDNNQIDQQNCSIEQFIRNIKTFNNNKIKFIIKNLNKIFKYLKLESEKVQQITENFQNQLINVKNTGEKLSRLNIICRSLIISLLNIHQNKNTFTSREIQMLILYISNSDLIPLDIHYKLINKKLLLTNENLINEYKYRLGYVRLIINLLKQITKLQFKINILNDILIKSILSKNKQSLCLSSNIFNDNHLYQTFLYQIKTKSNKENIYIRCIRGELTQNDINIIFIENPKYSLPQINYNLYEKYSHIYYIQFKQIITYIHRLTIAIPCFTLPKGEQTDFKSRNQLEII